MENLKSRRWLLTAVGLLTLGLICWLVKTLYNARVRSPLPQPSGQVLQASNGDWGHIVVKDNHCVLVNNTWNKGAAGKGFEQEVFLEDVQGKTNVGWRWRSPWHLIPRVVSQPQLVCGDKPWDPPLRLIPGFPFLAGSRRLTADFNIKLRASGTYNMVFTVWAVSALPPARNTISHEIMIWNANGGQGAAGTRRGVLDVQGTTYDVYVEENHGDNSGANANVWTYVAFVSRQPVLRGPLNISAFTDYLTEQGILSRNDYLTSLEIGNEVSQGEGIVEIGNFSIQLQ